MTDCTRCAQLLSARLDGSLTPEEIHELEEHFTQCPACRALESRLAAIHAAFADLEEIPAPEGFARDVMDRVRTLEEAKRQPVPLFRRPQIRALAGLAACALLCVGLVRGLTGSTKDAMLRSTSVPAGSVNTDAEPAPEGQENLLYSMQYMEDSACVPAPAALEPVDNALPPTSQDSCGSDACFYTGGAASAVEKAAADMAEGGQDFIDGDRTAVSASLLVLARWPEGSEQILDPNAPAFSNAEGQTCYEITPDQLNALALLAREQGIALSVTPSSGTAGICAVVISPEE